jgi:DNA-binding transcriptional ArsR family regulator
VAALPLKRHLAGADDHEQARELGHVREYGGSPLLTGCAPRAIVNRMVQYQPVDRTLSALADPTRRQILERLSHGSASISELAQPLGMTLTGVKKHVRLLEDAGLVNTRKIGRVRECELGRDRLENLEQWITDYREAVEQRLDRLERLLEQRKGSDE